MLKQFTAYTLSFLMVNQMAYPPEARAAAANRNSQQLPADQLFQVIPGKPLSTTTASGSLLDGTEFQSSKGQSTPLVWSNDFAENQGYIMGNNFQDLAQSANKNRLRNEVLAKQMTLAYQERQIEERGEKTQKASEAQAERVRRREVGEFQGLLYQALKAVSEASQSAATPIKGQTSSVPMATEAPVRRGYIDPTLSLQLQKKLEASGQWLSSNTRDTNEVGEIVQRYQENTITFLADKERANEYKLYSLPKLQAFGQKYGAQIKSMGQRLNIELKAIDKNLSIGTEELFNLLRGSQLPPDLIFAEVYLNLPSEKRDPKVEAQLKLIFAKFARELVEKKEESKRVELEKSRDIVAADSYRTLRRQKNKEERKERAKKDSQSVAQKDSETKQEAKTLPERAAEIGMSPAQVKKHQLALIALLGNLRKSIQAYSDYTGEKVEGRLAEAVKKVTDLQWDLEKRPQARLFLENLREALQTGGGFFQMMEFEQKVQHDGEKLRGKFKIVQDLHNDLVRFQLQSKTAGQVFKESASLTRFARDTFLFSFAIGAVMAQQLYLDYGANPVSMLQHLQSMKDPLGNISFYSFIIANGVSSHLLNLKATSKEGYAARLKAMRLVPYISMTAGSLASNIMSDAGQLFKACVWGIYFNKQEKTDPHTLSACDESLRTLTVTGKINQYVPTILSMLLSNKAAAVIETEIRGGISKAVDIGSKFANGTDKIKLPARTWQPNPALGHEINTVRLTIDSLATTTAETLLNRGASAAKGVLKFMGAQVALRFTPGGVVVSGVQLLFMVVQFAAFTYLDHLIMPNVSLLWASTKVAHYDFPKMTRRMETTAKFAALNGFLKDEIPEDFRKLSKWDTKDIPIADCEMNRGTKCDKLEDLVLDWRDFHAKWRADQNARFEQAFVGWGEALKNVTNQFATSKEYYAELLTRHARDLQAQNRISTGVTAKEDIGNISFFMNQPAPFYGVIHKSTVQKSAEEKKKENEANSFAFELDDMEPTTSEEIEAAAWKSQYNEPKRMQGFQHKAINQTIEEFDKTVNINEIQTASDRERYIKIREALKSQDIKEVVKGLRDLRIAVYNNDGSPRPSGTTNPGNDGRMKDPNFAAKLLGYYKLLGEPNPILTPGMSYPYLFAKIPSQKKEIMNYAVPVHGSGYTFEKATDYLTWKMLCGEDHFKVHQTVGFAADFMPPSITGVKDKKSQLFCMQTGNVPWSYRYMDRYTLSNGEEVNGLMTYLLRNIRPEILGDPTQKDFNVNAYREWWDRESLKPMEDFYRQKTAEWTPMYRELTIRLKTKSGPNENNAASTYFGAIGFIAASIISPLVVAVDYLVGAENRWDWYSPYDKSFGDAFKSFLRSFNLNGSLSQNLVDDLRQELSVYNTLLIGLVAADAHNERNEMITQGNQNQLDKFINSKLGIQDPKKPIEDGSFLAGSMDNPTDLVSTSTLMLPEAEPKPDLLGIAVKFVQQIEKNLDHLARVQVTPSGVITGQPTRSELRELAKEFDEIHMIVKGVLPKYMRNDFQKRLLENLLIGYTSALNDLQKYRMAANLTNYDRNEDRKDRDEEQQILNKLRKALPVGRPSTGANPRGI